MFELIAVLSLVFVAIFVVASMMIVSALHSRKVKINWFLLKLYIPIYAHQYKKISETETGKTSLLFYIWLISVNLALMTGLAAILLKFL